MLTLPSSSADQLRCAELFVGDQYPVSANALWRGVRYAHDSIRIAYLSADFHQHATARLMAGLFELHDRSSFETTALSFGPADDSDMRRRLQRSFDRFVDVRMKTDQEIAELVRKLEIDIAIDLKGFTQDGRTNIFAQRAAPIQVSYLGYPGTMGAEYIDYIIADRVVIPHEHRRAYAEKVVYLPESYQANDAKRRIAERPPTRMEAHLPEKGIVFCSFNGNYKITPDVFDVWMRLLREVEGSVLWLIEASATAVDNLRREAGKRGISVERLVFAPKTDLESHLARHSLADLFLDTLPYNAHTTASDALWAGLPVLTCLGSTFPSRVAASLLHAVELPELITRSLEEYEALALKLARDPMLLSSLKAKLANNRVICPLFDTDRFARHIEAAYRMMWELWQRGESPRSFSVDPIA
jgi:predicted O-linked N-acetylglucosamine transferase (SPINDLY family)